MRYSDQVDNFGNNYTNIPSKPAFARTLLTDHFAYGKLTAAGRENFLPGGMEIPEDMHMDTQQMTAAPHGDYVQVAM